MFLNHPANLRSIAKILSEFSLAQVAAATVASIFSYLIMARHLNLVPGYLHILFAWLFGGFFLLSVNSKRQTYDRGEGLKLFNVRSTMMLLVGSFIFVYLCWFIRVLPLISIPFIVVATLHLIEPNLNKRQFVVLSVAAIFLGFGLARYIFRAKKVQLFIKNWEAANPDTPITIFQGAIERIPFSLTTIDLFDGILLAATSAFIAGLLSLLIHKIVAKGYFVKRFIPHFILLALVVNLLAGVAFESQDVRSHLPVEPADESYSYDPFIYAKTFHKVTAGEDYYEAMLKAVLADSRIDKLEDWMRGYGTFRLPTVFFIWRIFASYNGENIFYLSLFLTVIALTSIFFGVWSAAGRTIAVLSAISVTPYLYLGAKWTNILFPDWWAMLFGLIAIGFFFRKNYVAAAVIAVIAALSREAMGLLIMAGLIAGIFTKERRVYLAFGTALAIFFSFYGLHVYVAKSHLQHLSGGGFDAFYGWQTASIFVVTNYLSYPVTFLGLGVVLPFAAIVAAFCQNNYTNRFFLAFILTAFTIYLFAMRTSSYWGQMFMPVVLMTLPFLLQSYLYEKGASE